MIEIPLIDLRYIRFLTDDFSIWQHSDSAEINRNHGYALDDAARALLVVLAANDLDLAVIYLNFLETACCTYPEPINFFDAQRKPITGPFSHDALGETYWALSVCTAQKFQIKQAQKIIHHIRPILQKTISPRTMAYTLLGACLIDHDLAEQFATQLAKIHVENASLTWPWLEAALTYANAILPLALLRASQTFNKSSYCQEALKMLDFLNETCKHDNKPSAIGNEGWYQQGGGKALYAQQPIDPAYQVLANIEAFKLTGKLIYKKEAALFLSWFWGHNSTGLPLIDLERGCCFDGIDTIQISTNAGAESTVCYLLAQQAYAPYRQ